MRIILFVMTLVISTVSLAQQATLELISKGQTQQLAVQTLRNEAKATAQIFGPYRKRELEITGYPFNEFLKQHLGYVPQTVLISAIDGYQIELSNFDKQSWFLVTHEDNVPLEIRTHGPLRLVETDIDDRDPENMSLFDDWIWMIKTIEAKP